MNPLKPENSRITREQGHEFANIFSIIIANAEMVSEKLGATGQVQRQLERIITSCHRGEELVRRIRNHGEPKGYMRRRCLEQHPLQPYCQDGFWWWTMRQLLLESSAVIF